MNKRSHSLQPLKTITDLGGNSNNDTYELSTYWVHASFSYDYNCLKVMDMSLSP